jgi:voltage-gated potassium channel
MFFRKSGYDRCLDELAEVALFRGLSRRELKAVDGLTMSIRRPAGTILARRGTTGLEVFVVVSGEVEMRSRTGDAVTIGAGELCGELPPVGPTTRDSTLVTTRPSELLVLSRAEFQALLRRPGMRERVDAVVGARTHPRRAALAMVA